MSDPNYTNAGQLNTNAIAECVGDVAGKPPSNKAIDKGRTSKMANILEGLEFPSTKKEIREHINRRSPSKGIRIKDILEIIENNLDDHKKYDSIYEVEVATGWGKQTSVEKPNGPDKALSKPNNNQHTEERIRSGPYSGREKIKSASARDVSPNTPTGEEV